MKRRLLSLLLCFALLASILAVPGIVSAVADTITWQNGAKGQYAVLDAVPTDTPLNVGKHIQQGTTGVDFNANGGNVSYLTDGNLDNYRLYYFSQVGSISYWENITIDLGSSQNIDRLFVASENAGARHVYMKFYASNDLATLYDATNLMAETKDGLGVDELNILMKGTAKEARYVGLSTYLPHASNEAAKYPSMAGFGNQFRLRELAVYAADTLASALGAQVRDTDAAGNTALRFGFDLTATGVKYANEDPEAANDYTRDLSAATVTVDGQAYTLVDFGAVLSLNAEDALTLESAAANESGTTSKVSAVNLYSVTDTTVRYTAVVTNIPAAHLGTAIYTRSYVTYNDGTKDVTVYGQTISRTVNGVTSDSLS